MAGGERNSIARFKEMTRVARGGGAPAIAGLKAGVGDWMQAQVSVTARDLAENKMQSFAKIDAFMRKFKPALRESGLYTKEELKALDNVHDGLGTRHDPRRARPHQLQHIRVVLLRHNTAPGAHVRR